MPSEIRVFILDNRVVNADNGNDAALWLKRGARELSSTDIAATFGEQAHLAGPHNTAVHADGSIAFTPPPPLPEPTEEELATQARVERDRLMRDVYDPAIMQALREHRAAVIAGDETAPINARIAAWDAYATALCDLTLQAEFPHVITWPEAPSN